MRNFATRFQFHVARGVQIDLGLGIGAYRGEFSGLVQGLWPAATVWQSEADDWQQPHNPEAIYVLPGHSEREGHFYRVVDARISMTWQSSYGENTEHYPDPIVLKKAMKTLDGMTGTLNFSGNWREQGIIKIDTQGTEFDIL